MSKTQKIFTRGVNDGRLLAIRNWRHRMTTDDAIIAVPLTPAQVQTYRDAKARGASDEQIFDKLFPHPVDGKIAIPIDDLTKSQLVGLIGRVLDLELHTLERMSRRDLACMLRKLCGEKRQTGAYLI